MEIIMKELYTQELIEKIKAAASAEEIILRAKENGLELTSEEAESYFAKLQPQSREILDEELENVAGGRGRYYDREGKLIIGPFDCCNYWVCDYCNMPWDAHTPVSGTTLFRNCPGSSTQGNNKNCIHCPYFGETEELYFLCNNPINNF